MERLPQGYEVHRQFLPLDAVARLRASIGSQSVLFQHVRPKAGMNLPYRVVDGNDVRELLPDVYALVTGPLHAALQEAAGVPLELMRDRKRAIRIQRYQGRSEGLRWHLDGGLFSILLTLVNTNGGSTEIIGRDLSRRLKWVPYLLFPFAGVLERFPREAVVSEPGDLILMHGGVTIHRGTNPRDDGERLVLVASFDPRDRAPTPVWDWFARRLNY
jgi:hypothetical protein